MATFIEVQLLPGKESEPILFKCLDSICDDVVMHRDQVLKHGRIKHAADKIVVDTSAFHESPEMNATLEKWGYQ